LISADVNGDGLPDLALLEWNQLPSTYYQLAVMLNDGTGNFSDPIRSDAINTALSAFFGDFVLADFRNTGHPDLLIVGIDEELGGTPYMSFAPNVGGGHFGALSITNPANAQGKIGVGDFNRDVKLDFVTAGATGLVDPNNFQAVQTFLGNGDGAFRLGKVHSFGGINGSPPAAMYVGDFNNDAKLDLIVFLEANGGWTTTDDVYELLGNGDGTFRPAQLLFPHFGITTRTPTSSSQVLGLTSMRCLFPLSSRYISDKPVDSH